MKRLVLAGLALIVACGVSEPNIVDRTDSVEWIKIAGGTYITEITLPSGVRCVVYDDEIDCDWDAR